MKKIAALIFAVILLSGVRVFAGDVSIDGEGNVETGVTNPIGSGNLDVAGASGEHAVRGVASGTGAAGVYGENADVSGYGGYFRGNAHVTGDMTIEGTLTAPGLGDITSVNAEGGIAGGGTSGDVKLKVDTDYIQRRVSSSCTPGSSIRAINTDGTVLCETAGIITESDPEVGTNTSNYIPKWNGAELVTGSIYDNGNVGIGTTNPGAKLTVTGTIESTSGGMKFPDGTVLSSANITPPPQNPHANVITAVDPAGDVGQHTSITIGTDGFPVISYRDFTISGDLKVVKCGNVSCSSGNTITTVDSAGGGGDYSSITIGTDGRPVISYHDYVNGLKVAKCGNASCSSGNTITVLDTAGDVGRYTSITIGTDGLPVISYYASTNHDLKIAKCGNASCSSGNTITVLDTAGDVGQYASMAIGTDGWPVISYYDATNGSLKVAKCYNATCSSNATNSVVLNDAYYTSIAIGTDGRPVISYYSQYGTLVVVKCSTAFCSYGDEVVIVDDPAANVGQYTSITIGTDGLPVISYYDATNYDLKFAKCGNASCSSGNVIKTVDTAGNVGQYTSITIGTDGLPVISYYDVTNDDVKVAKCANVFCTNNWTRR